jgi:hypothetical membrane protein
MSENGSNTRVKVSYLTMRKVVGVLGILLPIICVAGTLLFTFQLDLRDSISAYFDSVMGPAFAGILFVVGWFLFAYKGYDARDDKAGDRACLFAMGVAIFPHESVTHAWVPWIHHISAALLFLTLAYFSYFLFTKTGRDGTPTDEKLLRNKIYRACGVAIVLFIALIGLYNVLGLADTGLAAIKPVLVLEASALWAFGFSWFVKGETLWKDAT